MPVASNILSSVSTRGFLKMICAAGRAVVFESERRLGRRFVERKIYDYRMLLDLEDRGISRTLLLFRERELEHKLMLEKVLRPGMTVLDIGANIGYYALMELSMIGPNGVLVAVEPSPSNVVLLKRNLALNGYEGVECHQLAISDRVAKRGFFISEMSNLNTFHDTGTGSLHLSGDTIDVSTTTVPILMAGRKPDLIRMDVEGHEVEVLSGLVPSVEKGEMAPMVIFETHLSRYSHDHDIEAPLQKLFSLGYRAGLVGSSSERGTSLIEANGYRGIAEIRTDDVKRTIFENVSASDVIDFVSRRGGIRTLLLMPPSVV